MAYYKLIRNNFSSVSPESNSGKAVHGTLCQVEHRYSGSAGEYKEYLTPICPTLENADYLIPALTYRVQVTNSPKFHRLLPALVQVPGRTGIRVHRGTKPAHSKGCILVSADQEQQLTALWLKEQQNHEDIILDICEY